MATGDGGESGKFVPKKGIKSSVVWNWYGFAATDIKQETPCCNLCLKPVAIKGSSTTNLFQHLKQRHQAKHEKCQSLRDEQSRSDQEPAAKKLLTVAKSFAQGTAYDKKGARWTTITDTVALYTAKDMVPIYTMEKTEFINLMKTLDPRFFLHPCKRVSLVQGELALIVLKNPDGVVGTRLLLRVNGSGELIPVTSRSDEIEEAVF
uniref:BED-type domain-containing protein n=1 Tax=Nothobranchius furzeri TaxID=105023 RepID=A0A1A8UB12_NOTFU